MSWKIPAFQKLTAPYAKNDILAQLQRIGQVQGASGPESLALAFDLDRRLVHNLQSHQQDGFHFITQVFESGEWLYCSSLEAQPLARLPLHLLPNRN